MARRKGYGQNAAFTRGYDSGNYANAYEGDWLDEERFEDATDGRSNAFRDGYLLGFFSSYETYEISATWQDAVAYLRSVYEDED